MSEEMNTKKEEIYYDQRSVAIRTPQSVYFSSEYDKVSMLGLVLDDSQKVPTVIVVKSKKKADALSRFLCEKTFDAIAVHGNHRQEQQEEAVRKFNENSLDIIITTDMIFKNLNLKDIKLLISYHLPAVQTYYNRLAFMKELGVGIALVSPEEEFLLNEIEENMKKEIEEKVLEGFIVSPLPTHKKKKDRSKKPRHRKNKLHKEEGKS